MLSVRRFRAPRWKGVLRAMDDIASELSDGTIEFMKEEMLDCIKFGGV
jgi:hypothetical protein